ncbi:MAG: glycosyltransferase [Pseudomonadota bacterium]
MRILFAGGNSWLPEASGGTQNSTDYLIRQSLADGHDCAVYCGTKGRGFFGWRMRAQRKLSGRPFSVDRSQGYEVMRTWEPMDPARVRAAVARFQPDVVVVQTRGSAALGHEFAKLGLPTVLYLRNVEFDENDGDVSTISGASFIANSAFTAGAYRDAYGIDCTVIPPTIDFETYRCDTTREVATLINVYPEKGYAIARDMAKACPDIPFLFLEAWPLDEPMYNQISGELAGLDNVRFERRTADMTRIYGRTKILLAPSQWEEAWGRVASEAQCSGIPVIGSARGGLPEAIGPGGMTLPHDAPISDWVAALRKLWTDETTYTELSRAAEHHAQRDQLRADAQFASFHRVLAEAVEGRAEPGRLTA